MKSVKDYKIRTFDDIIRILEQEPEWREKLRKLVLTDELINLPKKFDNFVENDFRPLAQRVDKIEKDVEILKEDVTQLKEDVAQLKVDVADLKGDNFERKVREKAPAYFGRVFRRIRLVDYQTLADLLEDAIDNGIITEDEKMELLWSDGVLKAKSKDKKQDLWVVFEVSYVVDEKDVNRALNRALILKKIVKDSVLPVVIGKDYAIPLKEIEEKGVIAL